MANPLSMLGDLNKMRKQAKQLQQQLEEEIITITKDDVEVQITGSQKIIKFSVQGVTSQTAIDVLNEAIKKSQELAAKKLTALTGNFGGMTGK